MDATLYNKTTKEYVLLSCYENTGTSINGFKVSLVKPSSLDSTTMDVVVSWGGTSTVIDVLELA